MQKYLLINLLSMLMFISTTVCAADLEFNNNNNNASQGDNVIITVLVNNAPNEVSAFGFDIIFDSSALEYLGYEKGSLVQNNFNFFDVNETKPGQLRIGGLDFESNPLTPGATGSLAMLTFRVLNNEGSSLEIIDIKDDMQNWNVLKYRFDPVSQPVETVKSVFIANTAEGNAPLEVSFDASGSVGVNFSWNFGDGTSSTEPNPVHTFMKPGTYTVTLTVSGTTQNEDSAGTNIIVTPEEIAQPEKPIVEKQCAIATFAADPQSGNSPLNVKFDSAGSTGELAWNFGNDTENYTGSNPEHIYNEPGTYTVTLTATGTDGCKDSSNTDITVITADVTQPEKPVIDAQCAKASFIADPQSGDNPLNVKFNSAGSIGELAWNFGDDTENYSGSNPEHTYNEPGTYTVTLTVTGPGGCKDSASTDITVTTANATPPETPLVDEQCALASFIADPQSGDSPLNVKFNSAGSIGELSWNFGDDTKNYSGSNPEHIYNEPGTYTVTLTATKGCTHSVKTTIDVTSSDSGSSTCFILTLGIFEQ